MSFDGYDTSGFYDEMFEADGNPWTSARLLHERIDSVGDADVRRFFIMASGLRSLRDKTITYFEEVLANWEEIGRGTPYQIIGWPAYGKPVLDRTLKYEDSPRISAADVDYPIDVVIYAKNSHQITEHRYCKEDLAPISDWWQDRLRNSVRDLPAEWIDRVFMNVLPATDRVG